jgi:hypothetical protein
MLDAKQIAIRIPGDLVAFLEQEAERDQRTLAALTRKILTDYMRDKLAGATNDQQSNPQGN